MPFLTPPVAQALTMQCAYTLPQGYNAFSLLSLPCKFLFHLNLGEEELKCKPPLACPPAGLQRVLPALPPLLRFPLAALAWDPHPHPSTHTHLQGYNEFSLLSLSCSDYLSLPSVGIQIKNRLRGENISLSLPSQRVDRWGDRGGMAVMRGSYGLQRWGGASGSGSCYVGTTSPACCPASARTGGVRGLDGVCACRCGWDTFLLINIPLLWPCAGMALVFKTTSHTCVSALALAFHCAMNLL